MLHLYYFKRALFEFTLKEELGGKLGKGGENWEENLAGEERELENVNTEAGKEFKNLPEKKQNE